MTRPLLILAALLLAALALIAHGGGLDSYGGHNDRKNGGYHFHRGPLAGRSYPDKGAALKALGDSQRPAPKSKDKKK